MNARQSKKNLKNSLLLLPGGELIKMSDIVAIRRRDARPEYKVATALLFDYKFGDKGNTIIVNFKNESDRDGFLGECQFRLGWR